VEFFAAQSKVVTLNNGSQDSTAQLAGLYRFPVTTTDFGEDADELLDDLKKAGYQVGPDGTIRRGDCLLFSVDEEAQGRLRADAEVVWHQQIVRPNEETAEGLNRAVPGIGARFENRGHSSIKDHVIHRGRR
jgi:hypothetical protein